MSALNKQFCSISVKYKSIFSFCKSLLQLPIRVCKTKSASLKIKGPFLPHTIVSQDGRAV